MKTQYEILTQDPAFRKAVAVETLVANASEVIAKLMAEQEVSKADLARRLGKSRAWVTQLLSGKANMTVRTLAEVAYALGAAVKLNGLKLNNTAFNSGRQPIAGKTGPYVLELSSGKQFRVEDDGDCPRDGEDKGQRIVPEYAA